MIFFSLGLKMANLRIIYTPDAYDFLPSVFPMFANHYGGNPALEQLRRNYASLRGTFPDIGGSVGVVTTDKNFRDFLGLWSEEAKDSCLLDVDSTYLPLHLLDSALSLREGESNEMAPGLAHRVLDDLLSSELLLLDTRMLNERREGYLFHGGMAPLVKRVTDRLGKLEEDFRLSGDEFGYKRVSEVRSEVEKSNISWSALERLRDYFLERFKANRVPRSFPLHYVPAETFPSSFYEVSLRDGIRVPGDVKRAYENILKAFEGDELDVSTMAKLRAGYLGFHEDLFGKTTSEPSLVFLLDAISEPKTLITDLYIVDLFPELKNVDFETFEFKLK
jgi:hypothetical protein